MFGVEVQGLSKSFGRARALDDVSFTLPAGSFTVVCGSNGAGKSTLLACLAGILSPDSGSVRLTPAGGERAKPPQHFRGAIGYVGPATGLYSDLSLEENFTLLLSCSRYGRAEERMSEEITRFELGPVLHKRVRECSTGVRRRAALVRALFADPGIVVLDEPFVHLDVAGRRELSSALLGVRRRGGTLLLAAHEGDREGVEPDLELELVRGGLLRLHPPRGKSVPGTQLPQEIAV